MIRRSKHAQNFTVIPNYIHDHIKDGLAVGILVYLLSKPEDWQARKLVLYKRFTQGRVQIDKAFKILEKSGYIHKQPRREKDTGQLKGWEWIVKDVPTPEKLTEFMGGKNRQAEIEQSGNRQAEIEQLPNTDIQSTEVITTEESNNNPAGFIWENLLSLINKYTGRLGTDKEFKVINDGVRRKYRARLKENYTKENIRNAIINAAASEYHIKSKYQYLTPEFFSRADKIDKYGFVPIVKPGGNKEYVPTL